MQGEIIAGALAASATVETDTITIDPERLLDLQAGQSYGPNEEALSGLEFGSGARVAPVLRRLVSPTNTRARIYDRDGVLFDSRNLDAVLRFDLPPPTRQPGFLERAYVAIRTWFSRAARRSIASSRRRTARATTRSATRCRASSRAWCASTTAAR